MKSRKIFAVIYAAVLSASLIGCDESSTGENSPADKNSSEAVTEAATEAITTEETTVTTLEITSFTKMTTISLMELTKPAEEEKETDSPDKKAEEIQSMMSYFRSGGKFSGYNWKNEYIEFDLGGEDNSTTTEVDTNGGE